MPKPVKLGPQIRIRKEDHQRLLVAREENGISIKHMITLALNQYFGKPLVFVKKKGL